MDRFLHYRISRQFSLGRHGPAYVAVDEGIQRGVVLKELNTEAMRRAQWQEQFRSRMQRWADLNDPDIALEYSLEDAESKLVLVREYVEGRSLQQLVGEGPVEYRTAVEIVGQLAAAVNRLHRRTLAHGNLTLSNVILTKNDRIKLVDAGLGDPAEHHFEAHSEDDRTTPGVSGEEAEDLYSIGVIFFQMLTGAPPFGNSEADADASDPMKTVSFEPYSQRRVPGVARLLIGKLLSRDRSDWFLSAEQLVQTIKEMASIGAEDERVIIRRKWSPTARQYMMISILALLLIIFWLVVTLPH